MPDHCQTKSPTPMKTMSETLMSETLSAGVATPAACRALAEQLAVWGRRLAAGPLGGAYASRFHGSGLDFAGLREYGDSDPARSIDWHATLRSPDRTYRRCYEEERDRTLLLACDLSASVWDVPPVRRLLLQCAALLGAAATANRDAVGLLTFAENRELFVAPARGPARLRQLLASLLACHPTSRQTDLPALLDELRRLAPPRCRVLLFSDFPAVSPPLTIPLTGLAGRHDVLLLRLLDDLPAGLPSHALLTLREPEGNACRVTISTPSWTPPLLPLLPAITPLLTLHTSTHPLPQLIASLRSPLRR